MVLDLPVKIYIYLYILILLIFIYFYSIFKKLLMKNIKKINQIKYFIKLPTNQGQNNILVQVVAQVQYI